jgi:hypothetical protein
MGAAVDRYNVTYDVLHIVVAAFAPMAGSYGGVEDGLDLPARRELRETYLPGCTSDDRDARLMLVYARRSPLAAIDCMGSMGGRSCLGWGGLQCRYLVRFRVARLNARIPAPQYESPKWRRLGEAAGGKRPILGRRDRSSRILEIRELIVFQRVECTSEFL